MNTKLYKTLKKPIDLTWDLLLHRLSAFEATTRGGAVYGVPTGGMILAGFLKKLTVVHTPELADIILDDIEDSRRTRLFYLDKYPTARFVALITKGVDFGTDEWLTLPWEREHPAGPRTIEDNITRLLQYIGEDPARDGLKDTPRRVIKSYSELYGGYGKDPKDIFTVFENDGYNSMVILKDIELHSTCEHHMLPFYGKAHVAYIPNDGKIVGISKLARLVDIFAKRLQVQERIGEQVTKALMEYLDPKGAACVIEAKHMCMCARGVGKQNSVMVTSSLKGEFMNDQAVREEFLNFIHRG